jgi:hypothetical protein
MVTPRKGSPAAGAATAPGHKPRGTNAAWWCEVKLETPQSRCFNERKQLRIEAFALRHPEQLLEGAGGGCVARAFGGSPERFQTRQALPLAADGQVRVDATQEIHERRPTFTHGAIVGAEPRPVRTGNPVDDARDPAAGVREPRYGL